MSNLKALLLQRVLQVVGQTNFYINCRYINKNTNNNDNKILYYCYHGFKMNPMICPSIHNNTYSHYTQMHIHIHKLVPKMHANL